MNRATGTRVGPYNFAVLALVLTTLSACEEGAGTQTSTEEKPDNTNFSLASSSSSQKDVEAPDVFEVTEAALWDGRPSLGGIWVAHPDVQQPERVVIENTTNNKKVVGALFRRERAQPGPLLQVSSAAADQLGMLAGAPTKLHVVALRREEIKKEPVPEEVTPVLIEKADEDADAPASDKDSAETDDTQTEEQPKRKWWQKKPVDDSATAAAGAAAAGAATTAKAAEATAETATATVQSTVVPDAPSDEPAKKKWWQKKSSDEITETPLDPIAGAAAAIDAAEPTVLPKSTQAASAQSAKSTSVPAKPYIQVGTFEVEANANTAAEKIRKSGLKADVRPLARGDKTVWRVLVGPAATGAERQDMLNKVKKIGFADAYIVKN
ncbi:MAG: SPOR domain-containing protein [Ruegeria sp.]